MLAEAAREELEGCWEEDNRRIGFDGMAVQQRKDAFS